MYGHEPPAKTKLLFLYALLGLTVGSILGLIIGRFLMLDWSGTVAIILLVDSGMMAGTVGLKLWRAQHGPDLVDQMPGQL